MGETENIQVRVGTLDDLDGVMELALMACAENAFVAPNPRKLLEGLYPALMGGVHGICGIIGDPGKQIEGVVVLTLGENWYSDAKILEEKAIFIHPAYRKSKGGRAARLCEFSKRVADELGVVLTIGVLSDQRTAGKLRMYERIMGSPPSGAYWLYGATTGQPAADSVQAET